MTVVSDALEFIDREIERAEMLAREQELLQQLEAGTLDPKLLNLPLYDYQLRGALFLACRGRSILGDDMGLGKTSQALAAIELLARERGIQKVLVVAGVCEISVGNRNQEIHRTAGAGHRGRPRSEARSVRRATFYRLVNYEQVVRDRDAINAWKPDVIVLDEARASRTGRRRPARK